MYTHLRKRNGDLQGKVELLETEKDSLLKKIKELETNNQQKVIAVNGLANVPQVQ